MTRERLFTPMKNYRKYYIRLLEFSGYPIPKDLQEYDVHHIDGNKSNSVYENLCLIHRDLHYQHHQIVREFMFAPMTYKQVVQQIEFHKAELQKGIDSDCRHEDMIAYLIREKTIHERKREIDSKISSIVKQQHKSIKSLIKLVSQHHEK